MSTQGMSTSQENKSMDTSCLLHLFEAEIHAAASPFLRTLIQRSKIIINQYQLPLSNDASRPSNIVPDPGLEQVILLLKALLPLLQRLERSVGGDEEVEEEDEYSPLWIFPSSTTASKRWRRREVSMLLFPWDVDIPWVLMCCPYSLNPQTLLSSLYRHHPTKREYQGSKN